MAGIGVFEIQTFWQHRVSIVIGCHAFKSRRGLCLSHRTAETVYKRVTAGIHTYTAYGVTRVTVLYAYIPW